MAWRDRVNVGNETFTPEPEVDVDANMEQSQWELTNRDIIHYTQTRVYEPSATTLESNRILTDRSDPTVVHAYKLLRTKALRLLDERSWNSLAVLGGRSNDGATLSAINLAISLAMDPRHTVLLVDMNLRRPAIHRYFGYVPEFGITDVLAARCMLAEALVCPGLQGLSILCGSRAIRNSSEVLASRVIQKLMCDLKSRYSERIMVFDLPPILEAEDALVFEQYYDAGILVLREGVSQADELKQMADMLGDKPLLGTVFNGASR